MSNYPLGAKDDPTAPYNEPLTKEDTYNFEVSIGGKVTIPYISEEQLEEKLKWAREVLRNVEDRLLDEGWNYDIDFDIEESFHEIW